MFNVVSRSYLSFINFVRKFIDQYIIVSDAENSLYQDETSQNIILMDNSTYLKLED